MPIIKSAQKKLRQDKKREQFNKKYKAAYNRALKTVARKKSNKKNLIADAYSKIDKALKKKIISKEKASRLKSRLSKLLAK